MNLKLILGLIVFNISFCYSQITFKVEDDIPFPDLSVKIGEDVLYPDIRIGIGSDVIYADIIVFNRLKCSTK